MHDAVLVAENDTGSDNALSSRSSKHAISFKVVSSSSAISTKVNMEPKCIQEVCYAEHSQCTYSQVQRHLHPWLLSIQTNLEILHSGCMLFTIIVYLQTGAKGWCVCINGHTAKFLYIYGWSLIHKALTSMQS